ncbi:hypothetical protein AAF712_014422 [Marasmius tenuissimus]|uniref:F-box domain-containing protein n=1 Tax=Marasmius tenuissimus TaxID=585030 RepID=A0ABR2ZD19_9AGAR
MLGDLPDSPFAAVLDTNHIPSPGEVIQMKSFIWDSSNRLMELKEEISRLEAEHGRLQTFVDKHNAVLSPLRRFSAELMIEIFTHCLPVGFQTRDIMQAPLLLTRVCRSWRTIASETPKLWDAIHINLPVPLKESDQPPYNKLLRSRRDGLAMWLDRAVPMPINISVSMPAPRTGTVIWNARTPFNLNRTFYCEIGNLVSRHSRRWKSMILTHVPDNIMDSFISHLSPGSIPLLESITITALPADLERPQMLLVHLLDIATIGQLRRLRIDCIPESIFDLKSRHWSALTHLHVLGPIKDTLPSILIQRFAKIFPSLTECALTFGQRVGSSVVPNPYTDPPTSWRSLRILRLFVNRSHFPLRVSHRHEVAITIKEIRDVFGAILAPSLTELSVRHNVDSSPAEVRHLDRQVETPFHDFLIQSGCASTLTHLDVNLLLRGDVLLRSLELLPLLKSLTVTHERPVIERRLEHFGQWGMNYNDEVEATPSRRTSLAQRFFHELIPGFRQYSVRVICPRLEEIEILDCSPDVVNDVLQLARLRARHLDVNMQFTPLRSLKVDFGTQLQKDAFDSPVVRYELDRLRASGMHVEWTWVEPEVPIIDRPTDSMPDLW